MHPNTRCSPNTGRETTCNETIPPGENSDWPKSQSRNATCRYLQGNFSHSPVSQRSKIEKLPTVNTVD